MCVVCSCSLSCRQQSRRLSICKRQMRLNDRSWNRRRMNWHVNSNWSQLLFLTGIVCIAVCGGADFEVYSPHKANPYVNFCEISYLSAKFCFCRFIFVDFMMKNCIIEPLFPSHPMWHIPTRYAHVLTVMLLLYYFYFCCSPWIYLWLLDKHYTWLLLLFFNSSITLLFKVPALAWSSVAGLKLLWILKHS